MKVYTPSKISRRLGERFFFKAERDASPKSAMVRRPYPPGMHGKRRRRALSEFGMELAEKQKVRHLYGLTDNTLKNYVRLARGMSAKTKTAALVELLELRLDNAVFRLGLAPSRRIARHMISYGHIEVNGKPVRSPSRRLAPGDQVAVRPSRRARALFEGLAIRLKKHQPPAWLDLLPEEPGGTVRSRPAEGDIQSSYNLSKVIEYYSR